MIIMEYKGFYIEEMAFGFDGYTVFFEGDDVFFKTVAEAKQFIDSVA